MLEKLYRLIRDFLFNAPDVSDMNLAEYLITNGVTIPVRCKDCKHWLPYPSLGVNDCGLHKGLVLTKENTYCSYGERKDND